MERLPYTQYEVRIFLFRNFGNIPVDCVASCHRRQPSLFELEVSMLKLYLIIMARVSLGLLNDTSHASQGNRKKKRGP